MKANSIGKKTFKVITKQKAVVAIIVMMVMMLFFDTKFYTAYSMLEMLRSAAILVEMSMKPGFLQRACCCRLA